MKLQDECSALYLPLRYHKGHIYPKGVTISPIIKQSTLSAYTSKSVTYRKNLERQRTMLPRCTHILLYWLFRTFLSASIMLFKNNNNHATYKYSCIAKQSLCRLAKANKKEKNVRGKCMRIVIPNFIPPS